MKKKMNSLGRVNRISAILKKAFQSEKSQREIYRDLYGIADIACLNEIIVTFGIYGDKIKNKDLKKFFGTTSKNENYPF